MIRHLWSPNGHTLCCNVPRWKLPFSETVTADPALVTCEEYNPMTKRATGAIAPNNTVDNLGAVTEYGILWDEPAPGLPDVSGPYKEVQARNGLERSAFDGKLVARTVTYGAWRSDPDESITFEMNGCARCDGDGHGSMIFEKFTRPIGEFTHWSMCPTVGEPILLTIYMTDETDA